MNIDHYTNQILQAILDELRASKQMLGFGHPPKPRYIYANRQYPNCLWYFWNGAKSEHEPIEFHALTGIVERLEIEEKEFRGKPDLKVNLHIRADVRQKLDKLDSPYTQLTSIETQLMSEEGCPIYSGSAQDRTYVIQSGYETLFAKGLLYTLSKLPKTAFTQPITIAVEPGDTEQVLFCRIYNPTTGQAVKAPYTENTNWQEVTQRAITKIVSAHGRGEQVVQTA